MKNDKNRNDIVDFLVESNEIEDVCDGESLGKAVKAWEYMETQKEITTENVIEAHKILMQGHLPDDVLGRFRDVDVRIGSRMGLPKAIVASKMREWVKLANKCDNEAKIQQNHVYFEKIHPFLDGNGRVGRILMNWTRIKAGLPILIIYEAKKQDYYKWFR